MWRLLGCDLTKADSFELHVWNFFGAHSTASLLFWGEVRVEGLATCALVIKNVSNDTFRPRGGARGAMWASRDIRGREAGKFHRCNHMARKTRLDIVARLRGLLGILTM